MIDIGIEVIRAFITFAIFCYLIVVGRKYELVPHRGWRFLIAGFGLLLFGALLDITDNFEALNRFVVIGDTQVESVLEKIFGYLLGFLLIAVGFWYWLPVIAKKPPEAASFELSDEQLGSRVSRRALTMIATAVTAIIVVFTGYTVFYIHSEHGEHLEEHVKFLADLQSDALAIPLWNYDFRHAEQIIELMARNPDFQFASIRDTEGNTVAEFGERASVASDIVSASRTIILFEDEFANVLGEYTLELSRRRVGQYLTYLAVNSAAGLAVVLSFVLVAVMMALHMIRTEFREAQSRLQREIEERNLAEQSALAAEKQNRLILEAAGDGIWGVDLEGKTTFVNPAAARMVGYDVEELIGEPLHGLVHHSLPDGAPCPLDYCSMDEGLRDGEVHEADDEFFWRSNGTSFPVKYTSTPIRKDGELLGAVLTFNDITEQLRVDRMKNEFISTVSHELRTPLTSVYGSLGLIRGGAVGELPDQAKSMIDIAYNNSDRLVRLINDILDVEKIASGRIDFEWVQLDIAQLVQRSIDANKAYADRYDVTLLLLESPPEKEIYGDVDRLMQVMTNLLSNAAKFSRKNSRIEISVFDLGPQVRISVRDHGAGIPEEFRDRLFDRFTQVDSSDSRQKGGSGLGLSICKAIVEEHGGKITFDSVVGKGTTFSVDLPVNSLVQPAAPNAGEYTGKPRSHQDRILVCEGDHAVAERLSTVIGEMELVADVVIDVEEARQLLAQFRYAAMILDVGAGEQAGVALIRDLRGQGLMCELPVLIISPDAEQAARDLEGNEIKGIDWLEKPLDDQAIEDTLRRILPGSMQDKQRVLHVEYDRDVRTVVSRIVNELAVVTGAETLQEAEWLINTREFDLVILDLILPDGAGEDLIPLMQRSPNKSVPVIVFSAKELSRNNSLHIESALVKSHASAEDLLSAIERTLKAPERASRTSVTQPPTEKVLSI